MKDLNYLSIAEDNIRKIRKEAFLTVKASNTLDTHDHWLGCFRIHLAKPCMMVAVHSTRHTSALSKHGGFYRYLPTGDMAKEVAFCSSKSGTGPGQVPKCATWK